MPMGVDKLTLLFQSSPAHEGRCYTPCGPPACLPPTCFNPHRPTRAGATVILSPIWEPQIPVSILTGPRGPVLLEALKRQRGWDRFQSSPAHEGRCYSIFKGRGASTEVFQSSPAHEGRCYIASATDPSGSIRFQSSPAHEGRCYGDMGVRIPRADCFNPHRPTRAGATMGVHFPAWCKASFNPHRPTRAGATSPQ